APDSVSIIGCDAANGTYSQLYSDERGVCRIYEMSIRDGEWELLRAPARVSLIGCDAANGTSSQLSPDERGVCRIYEMSIGDGEWKLWREGEPASQRFTGKISDDGNTITGRWEIAEDFTDYKTDFELTFHRVVT